MFFCFVLFHYHGVPMYIISMTNVGLLYFSLVNISRHCYLVSAIMVRSCVHVWSGNSRQCYTVIYHVRDYGELSLFWSDNNRHCLLLQQRSPVDIWYDNRNSVIPCRRLRWVSSVWSVCLLSRQNYISIIRSPDRSASLAR